MGERKIRSERRRLDPLVVLSYCAPVSFVSGVFPLLDRKDIEREKEGELPSFALNEKLLD